MSKSRRISLAAINIAMHAPHPIERYVELLQKAFSQRMMVSRGSLHGMTLGRLYRPEHLDESIVLSGEIYKFVKLDPAQPWFNVNKKEPASDEDVETINIPDYLRPHLQQIPFVFNAHTHRFWYVWEDKSNSLGPKVVVSFLKNLLQSTALKYDFPEVSITAVTEKASVDTILGLQNLEYLKIELVRPNPDTGSDAEKRWLERLEQQNTTKLKVELSHARNQTLEPDADTKEMATVAANNGSVYGRGRSADGQIIEDSTTSRPMKIYTYVNTTIETVFDVIRRAAID